jgi:hypothetical protein
LVVPSIGWMVGMAVGGRDVWVGRGIEVGGSVAVTKSGVGRDVAATLEPSAVQPAPITEIVRSKYINLNCTGVFYPKT